MNSDFQFCCARHLGNSVVVALHEPVASPTPCEQIRRIRVALIMVRLADASPTDGAQDTAATPRKAAVYDR